MSITMQQLLTTAPIAGAEFLGSVCGPISGFCCDDDFDPPATTDCKYLPEPMPSVIYATLSGLTAPLTSPTGIWSTSDSSVLGGGSVPLECASAEIEATFGELEFAWAFGNESYPLRYVGTYGFGTDGGQVPSCVFSSGDCVYHVYLLATSVIPPGRLITINNLAMTETDEAIPVVSAGCSLVLCCAASTGFLHDDGMIHFESVPGTEVISALGQYVTALGVPCDIDIMTSACAAGGTAYRWFKQGIIDCAIGSSIGAFFGWSPPWPIYGPDATTTVWTAVPGYRTVAAIYRQIMLAIPDGSDTATCCTGFARIVLNTVVVVRSWGNVNETSSGPTTDFTKKYMSYPTTAISFTTTADIDISLGLEGATGDGEHCVAVGGGCTLPVPTVELSL